MLEAGPDLNPAKDYKEHVWPYELPHRGAGVGGKRFQHASPKDEPEAPKNREEKTFRLHVWQYQSLLSVFCSIDMNGGRDRCC